jgi:hypothetical protein
MMFRSDFGRTGELLHSQPFSEAGRVCKPSSAWSGANRRSFTPQFAQAVIHGCASQTNGDEDHGSGSAQSWSSACHH